jgi:oligoendopeptidase F
MGSKIAAAIPRASDLDAARDAELLEHCRGSLALAEEAGILLDNARTYVSCVLSVDGANARGKELRGVLSVLSSKIDGATASLDLLLVLSPESFFDEFLRDPRVQSHAFRLRQARKLRKRKLGLDMERLLSAMEPDGFAAWGALYDTLAGTLTCEPALPGGPMKMGLAEAASLLRGGGRPVREAAWRAINESYSRHAETCAAMLNSIAGWRLTEYSLRSHTESLHFLDPALHQNRMRRSTLEAMMTAVDEAAELGKKALMLQARLMGLRALAPWDLLAGPPSLGAEAPKPIAFAEGLSLVERAYGAVDPSMAAFVRNEAAARRIEARSLPGKRPGAYCTRFPKSRNPRVYMTYGGSLSEISTLAHELGHAYHGHLLRELPLAESRYPMALAETASTFAETALGELLAEEAKDSDALLEVAWAEAQDAATFLLNIPARLAFESRFYELRAGKPLGPEVLSELMKEAWVRYYGDSLSEYDGMFWCSKLHFYKTGVSFYNFPYTFGYLFSLGVYARREVLGKDFHRAYAALLKDTGRMEVEELAERHLGVDVQGQDFWKGSIQIVRRKVERFAGLVDRLAG